MYNQIWKENAYLRIMSKKEMFNKWNDVVFNIKWSEKQKGFLKMWINLRGRSKAGTIKV